MAVMTTQDPDGVLLEEKTLKNAPVLEEVRNGTPEVNGHGSPNKSLAQTRYDDIPIADPSANFSAFASNRGITNEPNGTTGATDDAVAVKSSEEAHKPSAEESATADSEMMDAPAKSPKSPADANAAEPTDDNARGLSLSLPNSAVDSPISSVPSPIKDVVMSDAPTQPEPASHPDPTESTQETAISDVPPATPSDDKDRSVMDAAADASQKSPHVPVTADTSLSEPSQTTKVAREREVDSEDEPVAKRAKVSPAAEQVEVKPTEEQDRMDVDRVASTASLRDEKGAPKHLADDSLNGHPITDYMAKQLRIILAGVKKTKAGLGFKASVKDLWPQLWTEYSLKISEPMDISLMERKLRGEAPRYSTMSDFKSDVDLLVANSITFNGEQHDVTASAKATREAILTRMSAVSAIEPSKPEKKEPAKQHPTRHTEPRTQAQPPPSSSPRRPSKPAASEPGPKPAAVDSPAFAIPASNNGVPIIRRDSTKVDGRNKRPVKPAHPKDLVYDTKRKKKLPPELRFCDEVLTEIRKPKYFDMNHAFIQPVDPVALNIPSYHKVVKKPMDLQTMASKMNAGEYTSAKEFEKDFELIVKNCRLFNGEEHPVYEAALKLQQLFKKEFGRKDDWMAKHAPAPAPFPSNLSPVPKDESEDDDHESEADAEPDEEQKATQHRVVMIQKRLEEEQKKVNDMINSGTAEIADVEIAQSVIALLQKNLLAERAKLAALPAKKPAKTKSSKPKKSVASGSGGKKTGGAAATGGSGGSKKASGPRKPAKKKMGAFEKDVIATGISQLDGMVLEKAIDIIKKDTGQGENDSGELELDIEQLSEEALVRLYDLIAKTFPNLMAEKAKSFAAPPAEPDVSRPKGVTKSKKNKPMSRVEQERRLQQLAELRAQAGRQASGSQEPMESIEGNGNSNSTGRASADPVQNANLDSDDEESSEEE